ncbi:Uncharacterised protein [Mycobacteroides abscessus subsp. abscessus]|nr:Uncharacterised protein [Mycobacteroides abscessus subsp. abscessus]
MSLMERLTRTSGAENTRCTVIARLRPATRVGALPCTTAGAYESVRCGTIVYRYAEPASRRRQAIVCVAMMT